MKSSPFERTEAADQEKRDEESKNGEKDSGNHSATHPVAYRRIGADNQCDIARRFVCSISHLFRSFVAIRIQSVQLLDGEKSLGAAGYCTQIT